MESLQPLVKHRFWICCGLTLILVPLGWWMGTSSLAKESKSRADEIDGVVEAIPNGDGHPDTPWTDAMKVINGMRASHHVKHSGDLRELQNKLKTWPVSVASAMADAKRFGDPGSNPNALTFYRTDYYKYMKEEVYNAVDPVRIDPKTGMPIGGVLFNFGGSANGSGLTGGGPDGSGGGLLGGGFPGGGLTGSGFPGGGLTGSGFPGGGQGAAGTATLPIIPPSVWQARDPSWEEMWRAQESAWVLKMILQSINRVNDHKIGVNDHREAKLTIHEASIRKIILIALRGGSPAGSDSGEASQGTEGADDADATTDYESESKMTLRFGLGNPGSGPGDASGGAGAGGDPLPYSSAEADNDFGKQVALQSEGGEDGEGGDADGDQAGSGGGPTGLAGSEEGGDAGGYGQAGGGMSPYVENDPTQPFKTIGFVLKVVMKRKDVPLLVQELTDVSRTGFPVKILRIQEASRNQDHKGLAMYQRYMQGGSYGQSGLGGSSFEGNDGETPGLNGLTIGGSTPGLIGPGSAPGAPYRPDEDGQGGGVGGRDSYTSVQNALNDVGMGYVLISGLVTIYQESAEEGANAGNDGSGTPSQSTPKESKKTPENGKKAAEKGNQTPENSKKTPEKGKKTPEKGKKAPENGKTATESDGKKKLTDSGSKQNSQSPTTDNNPVQPAKKNDGTLGASQK